MKTQFHKQGNYSKLGFPVLSNTIIKDLQVFPGCFSYHILNNIFLSKCYYTKHCTQIIYDKLWKTKVFQRYNQVVGSLTLKKVGCRAQS